MRILVLVTAVLAACGPSGRDQDIVDAPGSGDGSNDIDAPPAVDMSRIYAHSGDTLYRMNPLTLEALPIGAMTGIGTQNLLDLAVDKDDKIVGITRDKLYSINATSGAATLITDLSAAAQGYTSLTYAPTNPLDPNSPEILVSANDQGDVFRIDITGSQAVPTKIGSYGTSAGGKVISSGDLIGVRGFGIYATVDVGTGTMDYLAKIDPGNGWKATVAPMPTGYDKIFGLGFWGGKIYGFVDNGFAVGGGKMIQIDPDTGAAILLSSADIRWFGAGVATTAPIFQ
jgi:hypothetical protein